jgi:competence protein ComFC
LCNACIASFPRASRSARFVACFSYEGAVREVIARAKYRHERAALRVLAREFAAHVPRDVDLVTWAPASRARRARTGVDHGQLIANVVSRGIGVPARRTLRRSNDVPQTSRDRAARQHGPAIASCRDVTGRRVLVVDDVTTTGRTLAACAETLREAGAYAVICTAIARTSGPGERTPDGPYNAHSHSN